MRLFNIRFKLQMRWFDQLPFRYKLLLPISIVAFLFAFMASFSWLMLNAAAKDNTALAKQYTPVLKALFKADTDLHQVMLAERSVLLNSGQSYMKGIYPILRKTSGRLSSESVSIRL